MSPDLPERRWYDQISRMTMALHFSKRLPPEIRALIARHLNGAINTQRERDKNDRQPQSFGPQQALSLYKASSRLRWYDQEQEMHRAFNMMVAMPPPYLAEFAHHILEITQHWAIQRQATLADLNLHTHWMNNTPEEVLNADEQILLNHNQGGIRLSRQYNPGQSHHIRLNRHY